MSRIEEYLNSLDRKNLIMLYASVLIAAFVLYYNYNYSSLSAEIEKNDTEITKLNMKLGDTKRLYNQLRNLKKEYKNLKKTNLSLSEDLKYLNILVKTSPILNIEQNKFLDVLKTILQKATENNIKASYTIQKNIDSFVNYNIDIKGSFKAEDYRNFYNFVKSLESVQAVKEIKTISLNDKGDIEFEIKIVFWGMI